MIREGIKNVLTQKYVATHYSERTPAELQVRALNFLEHISLQRYLSAPLTDLDAFMSATSVTENPLGLPYPFEEEDDPAAEKDGSAQGYESKFHSLNAQMREKYGNHFSHLTPAKEYLIWQALFPKLEMGSEGYALVLTTSGCDMGDVMPFNLAVNVISAAAYLNLYEDGRGDLAEKIFE